MQSGDDGAAEESAAGGRPRASLVGRQLLLLTVWFALVAAVLELLARGVQKYLLGQVLWVSRDVLWMAPLGQLIIFAPVAAALLVFALLRRRQLSLHSAAGWFAFVAILGVVLTPRFMHPLAGAILAAGIGYQFYRFVGRTDHWFLRLATRTLPALALLLALSAVTVAGAREFGGRQALGQLPAAAQGAPNVILLIWDTVRARSLSLHGHERPTTPNLDRIARGGVVFENAIAPSPWTLPSHASLFTGYLPHQLSAGWTTPLDDAHTTLAEIFRDAGYATGGFAANVLYTDWEHGLARGFIHYEDYPLAPGQLFLSTSIGRRLVKGQHGWEHGIVPRILGYRQFMGRRLGESVDEQFLKWLDRRGDRPFFAFLNYFDAHLPYEPPAPFDTLFEPERPRSTMLQRAMRIARGEDSWQDLSEVELAAELAKYEASIAYLDHRLGVLLEELEQRGVLDNTVIVITSDHGEEFLEHGHHEHGSNLYLTQLHVPLVVIYPRAVPPGVRVEEPVSLRDIPATVAELTGVSGGAVFPGSSLAPVWSGGRDAPPRNREEAVLSELVPGLEPDSRMNSIIVDRHHYIRNVDGRGELYDYFADPAELDDLAADRNGELLGRWDTALTELLGCDDCCCRLPRWFRPRPFRGGSQQE